MINNNITNSINLINYVAGKNDAFRPPSIDDLTTFAENSQRISADDLGEILKILGNYY